VFLRAVRRARWHFLKSRHKDTQRQRYVGRYNSRIKFWEGLALAIKTHIGRFPTFLYRLPTYTSPANKTLKSLDLTNKTAIIKVHFSNLSKGPCLSFIPIVKQGLLIFLAGLGYCGSAEKTRLNLPTVSFRAATMATLRS